MTPEEFRSLALSLPEAVEQSHVGHPDFRVRGKIFATLGYPDGGRAMVKLTHDQQDALSRSRPELFAPVPGGWGRRGATYVTLQFADSATVYDALLMAWRNTAPKGLVKLHSELALDL
ncbi:MAG: hypothetical protein QOJ16_1367 [Acidobacteriota bacterium]|jgi:hypothetical protein|nr:hypothetical protein [Acidobacteriota bacterium]